MAWSDPRTWVEAENVTAALLNAEVRDNLIALKDPPSANYELNEGSDYTETSTSFVDVDGTNLALQITTTGGDVFVGFVGSIDRSAANQVIFFELDVDGSPQAGDDGIAASTPGPTNADPAMVSFVYLITGLSAALHTIKLQWKTSAGTATLFAGAGTSNRDVHGQFWCRELS